MIADPRVLTTGTDIPMQLLVLQQGLRIVLYAGPLCLTSARVQHVAQGTFLCSRNAERELGFDGNPASGVSAVEACQRRLPGIGRRIALRAIDTRSYCPKLRRVQVVGEFTATSLGPGVCTRLVALAKGIHPVRLDSQSKRLPEAPYGRYRDRLRTFEWRRRTGFATYRSWPHKTSPGQHWIHLGPEQFRECCNHHSQSSAGIRRASSQSCFRMCAL